MGQLPPGEWDPPPPDEWTDDPGLEDGKWYMITSEGFNAPPIGLKCGGTSIGIRVCCHSAQFIRDWFDNTGNCVFGGFMCFVDSPERILNIEGPFISSNACNAAKP